MWAPDFIVGPTTDDRFYRLYFFYIVKTGCSMRFPAGFTTFLSAGNENYIPRLA